MSDPLPAIPFALACGVQLEATTREEVTGAMAWAPERTTAGGALHGGSLMTLGDTLGAVCAHLNLADGCTTTTVESKTNFFRAVRAGAVRGRARPLHAGRRFIVVQTDLYDERGRLVAQVTQTQAVLEPAPTGVPGPPEGQA
ncbi:MAG: PaaI family thioesterase [Acidimicrobiales bacterium]